MSEIDTAPDVAAILNRIEVGLSRGLTKAEVESSYHLSIIRGTLERAEEVADQGCEFCDSSVTDSMETGEPHAHWWGCGECWNKQAEREAKLERAARAVADFYPVSALPHPDPSGFSERIVALHAALNEPVAFDNSRKQDQS